MPYGFLALPRILLVGHRWVTVSSNLIFPYRPRHRFDHLVALLSQSVSQLTLLACNTKISR